MEITNFTFISLAQLSRRGYAGGENEEEIMKIGDQIRGLAVPAYA
jgi:hypothetical protein